MAPLTPKMRAIILPNFGPPDVLTIQSVDIPTPQPGQVLIQIRAFGINHAEMHMRRGEWAEFMPIIGIECVGLVASCPGGELKEGTPVAALMGGLGRTVNGSYAEYTVVRAQNVVPLADTEKNLRLSWAEAAAIPESYATAWTTLFKNLDIKSGQRLLVRGGTSSFGQAAIKMAVQAGTIVTSTTRKEERFEDLKRLGVKEVLLERRDMSKHLADIGHDKFDAVLELIGNSTVVDSLKLVRRDGRVCLAGWLGGLAPIADFNPLLQMASGVHLNFFGSFVFGEPEFPLSDVPLRDIVNMIADGKFEAKPSRVFKFDEIQEAHRVMETNAATGKMVVIVK